MTTLADARLAVRDRLDEATARQWPDTMLDRWLHEACQDIARSAEVLQTSADVECEEGTQSYNLPEDVIRVHRATWTSDGETASYPLEYRDFHSADAVWWTQQAVTQGRPFMFTMWGVPGAVQATLYPTPSVDGTLSIQYFRLPAKASQDSDSLDLPAGWQDAAACYVAYQAMLQDRDQRWQAMKAEYAERLDNLIGLTRRYSDQSGSSFQPGTPYVNWWLYEFD